MRGPTQSKLFRAMPVLVGLVVFLLLLGIFLDYPYHQVNGEVTATTLDGKSYYMITVPVSPGLDALLLRGVEFNFSFGIQENLSMPYSQFRGATSVVVQCPPEVQGASGSCYEFLPQIQITFPDGGVEYFNRATIANGSVTYDQPASYPWFSTHTNPQVAVVLNAGTQPASLTFYVSK